MIHLFLQNLAWILVKALISTYKFEREDQEQLAKAVAHHPKGAVAIGCWHEQMIAFLSIHSGSFPYMAMASRSKDGEYAAFIARKMGFIPVRGSSRKRGKDKGGKEAIDIYISNMLEGGRGGITMDGPKGPRHTVKPGIVIIAQKTGAMILPGAAFAQKYWEFNSWDKFKLPKPFSRIKLRYAEPFAVPADITQTQIVEACRLIEARIKTLVDTLVW
ncbi:MAG: lysophospholipid acyltransferase family protein [Bdellovibrionota bacterium]